MFQAATFEDRVDITHTVVVPVSYYGPGDIVATGWDTWISSGRAFSSATVLTNLIRVRRASDNAEQDFATLANGEIDRASLSSFLTSTTGKIVKFYDQTGNSRHLEQATAANQAAVNLSGVGTEGVTADFTAGSFHYYTTTGTYSNSVPFTIHAVYNAPSGPQGLWSGSDGGNNPILIYGFAQGGHIEIYAGSFLTTAAAINTWHSVCGIVSAVGSGQINLDGTGTNGDPGGTMLWTSDAIELGRYLGGNAYWNGKFAEGGINSTAFSGTNCTNLYNNAQAFWGW